MLLLSRPFSAAFEGSALVLLLSAGARVSLPLNFLHLLLIAISLFTASVLPVSPFHSMEPEQLFLLALLYSQECL